MEIRAIREYLIDFQKKALPELIERELKIGTTAKIKSIIGPRRAGKTYFMYQRIKQLISSGTEKENIIHLAFEDPRLADVNFKEIREIIKLHWQLFPSAKAKLYLFVDEPQLIEKWDTAVRSLYDEGFNIFLTGSSSKLLSKEIATALRGRTLSYALLPFSFREFLRTRDKKFSISRLSSREKAGLLSLLAEYLEFGGYPEIAIEKDKNTKLKIIKEYLDMIIYRDIIERYKIKNTFLIKWIIRSLITSFSNEFSVHKVYKTLKSKEIKVSKNTLYSYLSMLQDSMFIFSLPKFEYSIRKREFSINKAYLCDLGFTKLVEFTKDKGKRMENVVFLELIRRQGPLTEISYWKNQSHEVDFVISKGLKVKQLVQVCYDIDDYETKEREVKGLLKASKELKCSNLLIITEDKEGREVIGRKKIIYVPLWKWLLV